MMKIMHKYLGFNALRHQYEWVNAIAVVEDRATLASDPSASIAAYSIGRYLSWYRWLMTYIYAVAR